MRLVKTNIAARYMLNIGFDGPKIKMSFTDRKRETGHFWLTSYVNSLVMRFSSNAS